jgi:hypothetical protein
VTSTAGQNFLGAIGLGILADTRDHINNSAERPSCAAPIIETIPDKLRSLKHWVVWKYQKRQGKDEFKWTKMPYDPITKKPAEADNPETWGTLEDAIRAYQRGGYDGIGFEFGGKFIGIDLDKCVDPATGKIATWALEIMREVYSYSDFSPSRTGIHIISEGQLPSPGINKRQWNGHAIEIYSEGRFFTITGDLVPDTPPTIEDREAQAIALYHRIKADTELKTPKTKAKPKQKGEARQAESNPSSLSDDEVFQRAYNEKFHRLWEGDCSGYPTERHPEGDHSSADMALCCSLARHTKDPQQIDRLFRRSGLYRDKWERADYREMTITNAICFVESDPDTSQEPANLTGREQIIFVMLARWNISDEVFRTFLAARIVANGRRVFKLSGSHLASYLRDPEGRDIETERRFGSDRINQTIEAFKGSYPVFIRKERGGGFNPDGSLRPASKYQIDEKPFEEAEQLAATLLPDHLAVWKSAYPDSPSLAEKIASQKAREQAATEVAARYKPAEPQESAGKVKDFDPITKLYQRRLPSMEQIQKESQKLVDTCLDMEMGNGEIVNVKNQTVETVASIFDAALSPEARQRQRRKRSQQLKRTATLSRRKNAPLTSPTVTNRGDDENARANNISEAFSPKKSSLTISADNGLSRDTAEPYLRSQNGDFPRAAIWRNSGFDQPVIVTGKAENVKGREYYKVEGSDMAIPTDEIAFDPSHSPQPQAFPFNPPHFCDGCGSRLLADESECSHCHAPNYAEAD